jgi:hypothetical protein
LSGYCNYHTQRKNLTGDAAGHIPSRAKFRATEKEVRELVELNPDHPGIEYGINFFAKWIQAAMEFRKGTVAMDAIRYIAARDATAEEMFVLSAAIYTVYQREGSPFCSFKNFLLSLGYRIARIMGMPGNQTPRRADRWDIGVHIKEQIGGLLVRIAHALDEMEMKKRDAQKRMSVKFVTDPLAAEDF